MADNRALGLCTKYVVTRKDNGRCVDSIVLELDDPNSWPAMLMWAATVEADGYKSLARDVRTIVEDRLREYPLDVMRRLAGDSDPHTLRDKAVRYLKARKIMDSPTTLRASALLAKAK